MIGRIRQIATVCHGLRPLLAVVLFLPFAIALAGCGSSSPATSTVVKPKSKADPRPRIAGKWKVIERPRNYESKTSRVTWAFRPLCAAGACSARIKSTGNLEGKLRFDPDFNSYTLNDVYYVECSDSATRKTVVRRAYRASTQLTLKVTAHQVENGAKIATQFRGKLATTFENTKAATLANCQPVTPDMQTDSVVAVRVG